MKNALQHRIIESFRLARIFKTIKSNCECRTSKHLTEDLEQNLARKGILSSYHFAREYQKEKET